MTFRGRVAVVGARRRRQGTGEWVARELARQGCEVVAVVGTTPATVEEACAHLRARHGIGARGYTTLEALLEAEDVDAVAICSPPAAHLDQLEAAAGAECHVLCEKPLFWSDDPEAPGRAAQAIDRLTAAGRTLTVNAQWPFTLPAFREIHPDAYGEGRPVERFTMRLSPLDPELPGMVRDSASHPLSMLQALVGPSAIEDVRLVQPRHEPDEQVLRWTHRPRSGAPAVAAELRLRPCPEPPRPAGYAINGREVSRRVKLPEYAISFAAEGARVPVRDPLATAVEDFVRRARAGAPPDRDAALEGMTHLQALVAATAGGEDP